MTGPVTTEALVEGLRTDHLAAIDACLRASETNGEVPQNLRLREREAAAALISTLLAARQQVTAERDEARVKIDAARVVAEGWPVLEGQETLAGKIMTLAAAARQATLGERGTQFVLQHLMRALDAADAAEASLATATSELARLRAEGEAKDRRIAELSETWTDEVGTVWSPPTAWAYAKTCAALEKRRAEGDEARSHLPEALRDASLATAIRSLSISASSENESKWRWGHALQIGLAFADKAAGEEWEHDGMASVDACYAMAAILNCECGGTAWNEMVKAGAARFAEHVRAARAATAREGA